MKFYTLLLALICIIMFILQLIPGFTDSLILNQQAYTEVWRFVTSIFLHANLSHLILNLFALIIFGLITEKLISSNKFLLVFLISGILANIVSVFFYPSSLGASGAIMGIIGVLVIIRPLMPAFVFSVPLPMFVAAIIWAGIDLIGVFVPDNIGHYAHLSGLVFGIIFGIYFRVKHNKKQKLKADYSQTRIVIPENHVKNWEDKYLMHR